MEVLFMTAKVKALYGFSPDLPPFVGKTPLEQVALLQSWGTTAVFGGYQNPDFIQAVHAAGMKIYAEFTCFLGADWWEKVPASRPIIHTGQPLEHEGWYYGVNPATSQVRQARLEALEKLLNDYALDGVWLDFIRWPCRWEGRQPYQPQTSFDPETLAKFSQDAGLELPQDDPVAAAQLILSGYEPAWTAWRCEQITAWVAQAKAMLERMRPQAVLGLFGIPWRLTDHDGAILKIIGQDYQALAHYVDIFSPMVYHLMCDQSPDWIGAVTAEIQLLTGKPVWPIIQSVDKPRLLSAEEYGQALEVALHHPASGGVLVFTLEGALVEAKLAMTKARFS
jgi:hypothetical protein